MAFRLGTIINDGPTMQVNLIGAILNIAYICCFFHYTKDDKDKQWVESQVGYSATFLITVFIYSLIENPKYLPSNYGYISTAVLLFFLVLLILSLVRLLSIGQQILFLREEFFFLLLQIH